VRLIGNFIAVRSLPIAVAGVGLLALALAGCGGGGEGGGSSPPPEQIAVVIAAGDIAQCDAQPVGANPVALTALLVESMPGIVLTLGDNAYYEGTADQFAACYAPTWGRFMSRTSPAPGNHDYQTVGAAGYFGYFGSRAGPDQRGYYSFDVGAWHLISLNSNIPATPGSAQDLWLRADLTANLDKRCVLAYWHHPVFSSGPHGNDPTMAGIWQTLYDFGADVVLVGHDHDYERFAPQDAAGRADAARGLRSFVVGTGGAGLYAFETIRANSEVRLAGAFGVVRLTLRSDRFRWDFIDIAGVTRDSGEAACH
jgi:calcineurin-like phosphoesterase family protein